MNRKSAAALVVLAALLVLGGLAALNPALRFAMASAAALAAAAPAALGRGRTRRSALVLFAFAAAVAGTGWSAAKAHMERYNARIREKAAETRSPKAGEESPQGAPDCRSVPCPKGCYLGPSRCWDHNCTRDRVCREPGYDPHRPPEPASPAPLPPSP